MELGEVLDKLGYAGSENYLDECKVKLGRVVDYGHLFRKAAEGQCQLKGVYSLRETERTSIPVVYVCEAKTEEDATNIHRLVWNQDTVPFLIVNSPANVRVYPGFCYKGLKKADAGIDKVLNRFREADDLNKIAKALHASAIDSGKVWKAWGPSIKPEYRVDYTLLGNLKKLDIWLLKDGLDSKKSHALIGKYVYLRYLRDRNILSDKKLQRWGINQTDVFSRKATKEGLKWLIDRLDIWLNGNIFPIDLGRKNGLRDEHISRVAGTFYGDEWDGEKEWQLHLFSEYDFSYIPIEVLSIVYQQFLHTENEDGKKGKRSKGREAGAYYTPIPVVNLMLSELEERRPLKRGMRVFDPSCGSGVFLVQAFRRLIEKEFKPTKKGLDIIALRELAEDHFFGVDTDDDACRIARLNLILTMLDYVHPPDLEVENRLGPSPLPKLDKNIFPENFFDNDTNWRKVFGIKKADWLVGNPPWKKLDTGNIRKEDEPILKWIKNEAKSRPVGNQEIARAFAWRSAEYVCEDGEIALFLPAMSLFEEAAQDFRSAFYRKMRVHTVANFSNLRWVISGGRFTAPAAAFFYQPKSQDKEYEEDESIRSFSPLLANQEVSRSGNKAESWSIVVNASEIRDIPLERVIGGEGLPWKIAAWGSDLDAKFLKRLRKQFRTIRQIERDGLIELSEGLQLRGGGGDEELEVVPKIPNAKQIDIKIMRGLKSFFAFPDKAISEIASDLTHARKGRVNKPLRVSQPPHIIVSAARTFAVYSDDFIIVPPRQIGIVSLNNGRDLLKAISLFLSSDFAFYYEFLTSTEFGVERGVSTLKALRSMPIPVDEIRKEIRKWSELHTKLVKATKAEFPNKGLFPDDSGEHLKAGSIVEGELIEELNDLVNNALGLGAEERAIIHDLVRVRLGLNDGGLDDRAVKRPKTKDLEVYGKQLQAELDAFIRGELSGGHEIEILHDDLSGMVRIKLVKNGGGVKGAKVFLAGNAESKALENCRKEVRKEKSQWVYFDRNLRAYRGPYTYIMKPMQRFHWTQTQARLDAREIIAETIGGNA
jgi:hypothetical protein